MEADTSSVSSVPPPNNSTSAIVKGSIVSVVIEEGEEGFFVASCKIGNRIWRGVLMDAEKRYSATIAYELLSVRISICRFFFS